MLDDAIKALTQIFAPPLRAVLWKSVGLALALIVVRRHRARPADHLARRRRLDLDRDDARAAGALAGERAGLAALGRRQPRHHRRQRLPDAGGDGVCRQLLRRSDRRRSRARALSRRSARHGAAAVARDRPRRQDGAARGPGLPDRDAVFAVRRLRRGDLLSRHRLAAQPRIFRARRHALSPAGGSEGVAQAQRGDGFSSPACSSPPSSRSRWSIWRRRCSPWR